MLAWVGQVLLSDFQAFLSLDVFAELLLFQVTSDYFITYFSWPSSSYVTIYPKGSTFTRRRKHYLPLSLGDKTTVVFCSEK